MTNVKSNYASPLALPNGQVIASGATIKVDNWSVIADHHVVKAWIDAKVIEVEEGEDDGGGNQPSPELLDLRAQYKELFERNPHHTWSEEVLKTKIDEKLGGGN